MPVVDDGLPFKKILVKAGIRLAVQFLLPVAELQKWDDARRRETVCREIHTVYPIRLGRL